MASRYVRKTRTRIDAGDVPAPTNHTIAAMSAARARSRPTSSVRRSNLSATTPPAAPNSARGPRRATAASAMSAVLSFWSRSHTSRPTQNTASPRAERPSAASMGRTCF